MKVTKQAIRSGFTLIELLVVIAIIAILIALLVPAVQKVREAAARTTCTNNLKNLALATHGFHDSIKHFPYGASDDDNNNWGWGCYLLPYIEQGPLYTALTNPTSPYRMYVPPNMGGGPNSLMQPANNTNIDNLNFNISATAYMTTWGTSDVNNQILNGDGTPCIGVVIPVFLCPSDNLPNFARGGSTSNGKLNQRGKANYLGNMGNTNLWGGATTFGCGGILGGKHNGMFPDANENNNTYVVKMGDVLDGTSNTVLFGEVTESTNVTRALPNANQFPIWAGGNNGGCNGTTTVGAQLRIMAPAYPMNSGLDQAFGSKHTGGAHFAFADGTVRMLQNGINTAVYAALGSRDGGETVSIP
jgi:prepilin-type N-terminal cleavage/methylation domain-containing protein/prepilin-type processing-associated H-X9-DG protein